MVHRYAFKRGRTPKRHRRIGGNEVVTEENNNVRVEEEREDENEMRDQMPGIPISPVFQKPRKKSGVIFVLERAALEVAKIGKTFQILNTDDHANFLMKHNRNPADYRPDIVHQAILAILDSRLAKAERLQALYVRTEKGVLFEIKPNIRMPRTFKRFCGLMLQLLQNLSINAAGKREKLLKVIKNPITHHLPVNSRITGLSRSSEKKIHLQDYVAAASDDATLVFVLGTMSYGNISNNYTDDLISISDYPLSAACCLSEICTSLQNKWKIV